MSRSKTPTWKAVARDRRTVHIKDCLGYTGYRATWYTPYQVRIWADDVVVDFFPTGGKYHDLDTGGWGSFDSVADVFKILGQENV